MRAALAARNPTSPMRCALLATLSFSLVLVWPQHSTVAAPPARLVVVAAHGRGAPNVRNVVSQKIQPLLRRTADILSYKAYSKAARAAGVRAFAVDDPAAAVLGGRGVAATHVLIIRSTADKDITDPRGRAVVYSARAQLIDAITGETLFSRRYPLLKKTLSPATVRTLVGDVQSVLAGKQPASLPEPVAPALAAPTPPPPPPAPAAPRQQEALPALEPVPQLADTGAIPFGSQGTPKDAVPPAPVVAPEPGIDPNFVLDTARWRPALRMFLGPLVFSRQSFLRPKNGSRPPSYAPPKGKRPPFFTRFVLDAEIYPAGFGGRGAWWEGFGLHGQVNVGWAKTGLPQGSATNAIGGASAGAQYRWVVADSKISPDITARGGVSRLSFPLDKRVPYPSVGYVAGYVGLGLAVPIEEHFALTLDGTLLTRVVGFGGTAILGDQYDGGLGYHAQVGARLTVVDSLSFKLLADVEGYSVPFRGDTRLPVVTQQYTDVTLKELTWGVLLAIGFST